MALAARGGPGECASRTVTDSAEGRGRGSRLSAPPSWLLGAEQVGRAGGREGQTEGCLCHTPEAVEAWSEVLWLLVTREAEGGRRPTLNGLRASGDLILANIDVGDFECPVALACCTLWEGGGRVPPAAGPTRRSTLPCRRKWAVAARSIVAEGRLCQPRRPPPRPPQPSVNNHTLRFFTPARRPCTSPFSLHPTHTRPYIDQQPTPITAKVKLPS